MYTARALLGTTPKEMPAWVIREQRHGVPREAMQLEYVDVPSIGPNEVLLLVKAAGINYNGLWACMGKPVPLSRLKTGYDFLITGSDAAGIVWQVGEAVKRWKPGDEVIVHCNVSCNQCSYCNGFDPLACEDQKIWGYETNWGAFAPFAKVQAQQLLPKPPHLSWEAAASYSLCLFTAYRMLVTRARVQAGENVLIWGAAGGLGVFAIQLSRLYGANPLCIVSSDEKAAFCRELGADRIINRTQFDLASAGGVREFGRAIRSLTGGRDPDIVFEHVGRETFSTSVFVCGKFGRVVVCGATSGFDLSLDVRYLWMRQKTIIGSHFANSYDADRANRLIMEQKIRPIVWRTMPFDRIPEAQMLQGDSCHMGKIAIDASALLA
jgi:crotonyl-CoA carboxylase/reductase